jgi:hypothetical protein
MAAQPPGSDEKTYEFADLEVVCEEPIPTIFADGYWGSVHNPKVVRLNLVEERFDSKQDKVYKYVVARLVMPTDAFINVTRTLSEYAESLKKSYSV